MNLHRALLAVVIGVAAAPASAQMETMSVEAMSVDSALSLEAAPSAVMAGEASLFDPVTSPPASLVGIKGVVSGSPESVSFSGQAKVSSRLAPDPDFFKPRLVLSIDLSGVAGIGASTGAKYVISGPELLNRDVALSHTIEITFPFRGGASLATPRTGVASFVLDFDPDTGAVTKARGNVSSPNFPR
jgi:hypothetical protein